VAAHGNKDGGICALDFAGMAQDCGNIQNMKARDAHQIGAKPPDNSRHAFAFKAHIDNAHLMSVRAERRRNVFQAQRFGAKKRSKAEVSGEMSWFDEQNSQDEFSRFSPTGGSFKQFDRLNAILEGFRYAVKRFSWN
jgi:hypothetical protein